MLPFLRQLLLSKAPREVHEEAPPRTPHEEETADQEPRTEGKSDEQAEEKEGMESAMMVVEAYRGTGLLDELPEEITLQVLSFLPARDLCQIAQTSKYYHRLAEEKELWKRMYFSLSRRQPSALAIDKVGWKWLYLSRLKADYSNEPTVTSYDPRHFLQLQAQKARPNPDVTEDLAELRGSLGGIGCLGLYNEKQILVGGTMRGKLLAIDLSTGELLRLLAAHKHTLSCLDVDENLAVSGSWDTTLQVWDLDTYSRLATLTRQGEIGYIRCCQLNKSRNIVVSGSNDNSVKTWELETGRNLDIIRGHDGAVTGLKFVGDRMVTGSWDKTIRVWSLHDKDCVMVLKDDHGDKYCGISYDPENEVVYGGREDYKIAVFDLRAGKMMRRLEGHSSWVYGLAHDETTLFSGSMDGKVKVWDRETNECYNHLNSVSNSCVHDLLVHDNILYAATEDCTIRVIDFSGPLGQSRRSKIE